MAKFYKPQTAYDFLVPFDGKDFFNARNKALCFVESDKVSPFFVKLFLESKDSVPHAQINSVIDSLAASQNLYLFSFLRACFGKKAAYRKLISERLCVVDGPLTKKWSGLIRAEGTQSDKKILNDVLKRSYSRYFF